MVCRCKPSCTVRVQELYSYKDVTHGTVQIIVYNQSDHDGVPPTAKPLKGKGDFTVRFCFDFGIQPTYHSHRPPGPALRAGRDTHFTTFWCQSELGLWWVLIQHRPSPGRCGGTSTSCVSKETHHG
jgi:hypothetical protein